MRLHRVNAKGSVSFEACRTHDSCKRKTLTDMFASFTEMRQSRKIRWDQKCERLKGGVHHLVKSVREAGAVVYFRNSFLQVCTAENIPIRLWLPQYDHQTKRFPTQRPFTTRCDQLITLNQTSCCS